MIKRILTTSTLVLGFFMLVQTQAIAQEKKNIEKPSKCDVKQIDEFVSKTFDAYDESKKITEDVNFIKIEGDPKTIKNGKGEELSKENALIQLGDLMNRAKKQNDNIKTLQDLQKPAQDALKKCPITQKPKATKNLGKGGEALNEVIKQTKAQLDLIEKQINEVKTIKDSK
jgi:hypothetical protein